MIKPKKVKKSSNRVSALNFELQTIQPKTDNQQRVFDYYNEGKNLVLYGSAGSGKSFLSLYLGIKEMLDIGTFNKIVILRSAVASRDLGFLPGTEREKISVYEAPYRSIINDLFGRDDAYDILKQKDIIEFESTSFLRGMTYSNCLIFVDEIENMAFHELNTIFTRIGEGTKIIFAGDIKQCDLNERKETSGMKDFLDIMKKLDEFGLVEFTMDDCVRSGLVKNYLIAKESLGL
jgi:phosphate starvation-inducible PhoH-like protein